MEKSKIEERRYRKINDESPDCYLHRYRISSLSEYLEVSKTVTGEDKVYWFRGQGNTRWRLTPRGLRYDSEQNRTNALKTLDDFKRYAPTKLKRTPNNELEWVQLARHYGLPTRLLDWTQNSAIGLYFACKNRKKDGLVFLFDPVDLNTKADPENPRIFDANRDAKQIKGYLNLTGRITSQGNYRTIAINPVWNSERILQQQGTFTLHGNRTVELSKSEVSSLVALPILKEDKEKLLQDLEMIGIDEMSIFPEPEHIASYLTDKLVTEGGG